METCLMKNLLKKYWYVILIFILIPIIINCLILKPALFKFVGEDTDWLGFWGTYIATILSSIIAFYVLHKQLDQNQKENENNRQLQINILKYQQQSQWLTELKVKLTEYYNAFNLNDVNAIADRMLVRETDVIKQIKEIKLELKKIIEKFYIADFSKGILFSNEIKEQEIVYLTKLKLFSDEFYALLKDFDWYISTVFGYIGNDEILKEQFIKKTKKYQDEPHPHTSNSRRMWEIIEEYEYKIVSKNKYIIAKRMSEATEYLDLKEIQKSIVELIDYENHIINKLITKEDDTK